MISNPRHLAVAREKLSSIVAAMHDASDPLEVNVYNELIREVEREIREYEQIATGRIQCFTIGGMDDLGPAVIKARIARSWSQTKLAELLGVTPQMVQKDEAREYEASGIARLADILDVLGFELVGAVRPKTSGVAEELVSGRTASATASVVPPFRFNVGALSPHAYSGSPVFEVAADSSATYIKISREP